MVHAPFAALPHSCKRPSCRSRSSGRSLGSPEAAARARSALRPPTAAQPGQPLREGPADTAPRSLGSEWMSSQFLPQSSSSIKARARCCHLRRLLTPARRPRHTYNAASLRARCSVALPPHNAPPLLIRIGQVPGKCDHQALLDNRWTESEMRHSSHLWSFAAEEVVLGARARRPEWPAWSSFCVGRRALGSRGPASRPPMRPRVAGAAPLLEIPGRSLPDG